MKVIVQKRNIKKENKYPCIMISDDYEIVLFYAYSRGICLYSELNNSMGVYAVNWDMSNFKIYKGNILLEND